MHDLYVVDLKSKPLEVRLYTVDLIKSDMQDFGQKKPMDLQDFDWRLFETLREARLWLVKYRKALRKFHKMPTKHTRRKDIPCILYKERYAAQTILGEKMHTKRHYLKPWQRGQLFYLQGRMHFLCVKLTHIEKKDGKYIYSFDNL